MMDPIDALVSHAQYYWNRLESSTTCCESEASLSAPVHIVDVPTTTTPQGSVPLKTQECANLKILNDYLGNSKNANYNFRLMLV